MQLEESHELQGTQEVGVSLQEAAPNEVKGEIIKSDLSAAGFFFAKVELRNQLELSEKFGGNSLQGQ